MTGGIFILIFKKDFDIVTAGGDCVDVLTWIKQHYGCKN